MPCVILSDSDSYFIEERRMSIEESMLTVMMVGPVDRDLRRRVSSTDGEVIIEEVVDVCEEMGRDETEDGSRLRLRRWFVYYS